MSEIDRDRLRSLFAEREGKRIRDRGARAAVAPIFRAGVGGPELLFIERSKRLGDPWSGHMAFPGGRVEAGDRDTRATAERETLEEVGLDLSSAEHLGRLDDLAGRRNSGSRLSIAAHVYWWPEEEPRFRLNHEVADALWIDLESLLDPIQAVDYRYPLLPLQKFPGIRVGAGPRVIWGLTYRFLEDLLARLERPLRQGS